MLLVWDARCNGQADAQTPHTQTFKPIMIIEVPILCPFNSHRKINICLMPLLPAALKVRP